MTNRTEVIRADILLDLDGVSVKEAMRILSEYDRPSYKLSIDVDAGYNGEYALQVIREETKEERADRLLKEKEAKALLKLEKERKLYLDLKAKFEGE